MKNFISKFKYLAGLFLIVGLFACEGPAGDDGTDGTDGIAGTDGADGADGNANVFTVTLLSTDIYVSHDLGLLWSIAGTIQ